jgi:hypothetical protein
MNPNCLAPQELFDNFGGKIASLNPYDLRRRTDALRQAHKIQIRADHGGNSAVLAQSKINGSDAPKRL